MEDTKDLAVVKRTVTMATNSAQELVIEDQEGLAAAADARAKVKTAIAAVEERSDLWTRPAYAAYKTAMDNAKKIYGPLLEDLKAAGKIIDGKLITYKRAVDEKARIEREKIAAQVESGRLKNEETIDRKMNAIETVNKNVEGDKGGTITFKKKRVLVITDRNAIPDEYWFVDEVLLRKNGLAKGAPAIPGTKVEEVDDISGSSF